MVESVKKGYWIAHVDVHDPERYKDYVAGAAEAFEQYDAKFFARGGDSEVLEGDLTGKRHVIIEFKDLITAKACWSSSTYQAAREHRLAASKGSVTIVEGIE
ncbi:MAG: DUF1330 domain-containing protein [Salaquimonas sp.]